MALHDNEFPIDDELVAELVHAQAPQWSSERLHRQETTGTVNVGYRLGDDKVVRLPRSLDFVTGPEREACWMPLFAAHLPLRVPGHLLLGRPTDRYPAHWSVLEWVDGAPVGGNYRAFGLADVDQDFRSSVEHLPDDIDRSDLLAAWWLVDGDSRETFRRAAAGATTSYWERAEGWALHMAVLAIPYYAHTNPGFVGQARRALAEILG